MTDIEILYANEDLIAIHKKPGLPCQSRDRKERAPLDRIFPKLLGEDITLLNRIDQPAGGILLWQRPGKKHPETSLKIKSKTYLAIVEGHPEIERTTLRSFLWRDGRRRRAVENREKGKKAVLHYRLIHRFDRYSLLEIDLVTGRFHQIRKQLSDMGHPVRGDVKYGARRGHKDRSIDLHALAYEIILNDQILHLQDVRVPDSSLWDEAKNQGLIPAY